MAISFSLYPRRDGFSWSRGSSRFAWVNNPPAFPATLLDAGILSYFPNNTWLFPSFLGGALPKNSQEFFQTPKVPLHEGDPAAQQLPPFFGYAIIPPCWPGSRSVPGRRDKTLLFQLPQMSVDHPGVRRPIEKAEFQDLFQEIVPVGRLLLQGEKQAGLDEPLGFPTGALAPVVMTFFLPTHASILYRL